ncbi:MAG TPA: L,D-transpeptidase family protein [Candidatus Acidoferrales bacterium]
MRRFQIITGLLLVMLATAAGIVWGSARLNGRAAIRSQAPGQSAWAPQTLSSAGQDSLQAIIKSGNLPEMRWPNFSDYTPLVQEFYGFYGSGMPWMREMQPTPQAQQIIALLLKADQKGLSADDYDGPRWAARLAKFRAGATPPATETDALTFDAELTVSVMRYISDLHIGKVNPKHFDFGLNVNAKKYDLPTFVKENVVTAPDVAAALVQIEPPYPGYQRTMAALQNYLQLAKDYDGKPLPVPAKPVLPGDPYEGVPQLERLLQVLGDLPPAAVPPAAAPAVSTAEAPASSEPAAVPIYQGAVVEGVKNFQRRHARTADGKLMPITFSDLNTPLLNRVREMQLTLERWRWLPIDLHASPIVANIPEFRLRAYDENFKIGLTMNVVVGKAYDHDTPVFLDSMQYVVFRPYWNVPYSIARAEFLPRIARDPNYLEVKGFQVVDAKQQVVGSGPVTPEVLAQLRSGKLFIRQNPGPKNSLGLVKFIFPNSYNVYMHDSPEQELFSRTRRDFSHGCIRLERPADLAAWVLRDDPKWTPEKIRAAMQGTSNNSQVNLAHPIPVLIIYATVVVTEDGKVHFFDDIYGQDAALEKVLMKGYPFPSS